MVLTALVNSESFAGMFEFDSCSRAVREWGHVRTGSQCQVPPLCMQTAVMKSDGDGDEPEFRGGGFCATSQSKLLAELEPTTTAARWEETLSLGKCPRVLVGKSQGCTIQKQALGGSPDRMDSLKDLGPMRTKIPVFLLVGQIPGWGSSLQWTGGRPLV